MSRDRVLRIGVPHGEAESSWDIFSFALSAALGLGVSGSKLHLWR